MMMSVEKLDIMMMMSEIFFFHWHSSWSLRFFTHSVVLVVNENDDGTRARNWFTSFHFWLLCVIFGLFMCGSLNVIIGETLSRHRYLSESVSLAADSVLCVDFSSRRFFFRELTRTSPISVTRLNCFCKQCRTFSQFLISLNYPTNRTSSKNNSIRYIYTLKCL